jgi:hypothetical protein
MDRRGLNAMSPETRFVHERLMGWGDWQRSELRSGSPMSPIARMMTYGIDGAHTSNAPIEMPSHIEAVDRAVAMLKGADHFVIVHLYCEDEPVEAIARGLRVSMENVRYTLNRARWRISGYIFAVDSHPLFRVAEAAYA